MRKVKTDNVKMRNRLLAAFGTLSLLFAFASCDQLQDELSSEQLKDQKSGIGTVSASSTTYYYDGSENDSVKGKEAHLVLDLSQIADATDAAVKYTLEYSIGSDSDKVEYSSAGSLAGTLSDSKTKYYINLAPAINLIDGTGEPAYGDIAYTFILSGLTNASGNDYNGRSFPSFSKTVKFAPLYTTDSLEFSSKSLPVGSEIKIPLNGEISEVAETVTAAVTSGSVTANFTAKVSSDGKAIVLTSKNDLSGEEFTLDFTITGIKPVGAKEEYSHTFSGVKFIPTNVTLDGVLDEDLWSASYVATSADSYSAANTYQNIKKVSVVDDGLNLYVAVEFAETPGGNKTNIQLSFDTGADNGSTSDDGAWMTPATTTTFSNGTLDFKAYENIAWVADNATNQRELSNLSASGVCGPEWNSVANCYTNDSKIIEYSIKLTELGVSSSDKVKLFVSISQYDYTSENTETLLDCVPASAASVTDSGQSVAVDFSKALEYTIQ